MRDLSRPFFLVVIKTDMDSRKCSSVKSSKHDVCINIFMFTVKTKLFRLTTFDDRTRIVCVPRLFLIFCVARAQIVCGPRLFIMRPAIIFDFLCGPHLDSVARAQIVCGPRAHSNSLLFQSICRKLLAYVSAQYNRWLKVEEQ
jgi:hypothetical protein